MVALINLFCGKVVIPIGKWILMKIAEKGFDSLVDKLHSNALDKKFKKTVNLVANRFQKENPTLPVRNLKVLFREEKVFTELLKLLFKDSMIDVNIIKQEHR